MKYIYYNKNSREITQMAPGVDRSAQDPYIELSDADENLLMSNRFHGHLFLVAVDNAELHQGRLEKKPNDIKVTPTATSYVKRYSIPIVASGDVDVYIKQYKKTKNIHIVAAPKSIIDLDFLQQSVILMACKNNDPHYPIWELNIPGNTLSTDPLIHIYQGDDDIRFFSPIPLGNYVHEQFD
jgi:hypothetical protein